MSQDSYKNQWSSYDYSSQSPKNYHYTDFDYKPTTNSTDNSSSSSFNNYQSYSSFQNDNYRPNSFQQKQHVHDLNQPTTNYQQINSNYNQQNNYNNLNFYQNDTRNQLYRTTPQQNNMNLANNIQSNQSAKVLNIRTIRDVLQIPQQRQQFLKSLPDQQLQMQPQYTVLFSRPNLLLGIADYYEKIIPNQQFNKSVKSIKRTKDIEQAVYLTSLVGYVYLTGKLSPPGSNFKGIFKGKSHYMIPLTLTSLMLFETANNKRKTFALVNDRANLPYLHIGIRKFLCQANSVQKMQIFSQS